MKIPIKKTNRKVPRSDSSIRLHQFGRYHTFTYESINLLSPYVLDIKTKIGCTCPNIRVGAYSKLCPSHGGINHWTFQDLDKYKIKQQKGDWNEWHKEMDYSIDRLFSVLKKSKPGWLTRIKRIGRK